MSTVAPPSHAQGGGGVPASPAEEECRNLEHTAHHLETQGKEVESIRFMEKALHIRAQQPDATGGPAALQHAAERLCIKYNTTAVRSFKRDDYDTALNLLQLAMQMSERGTTYFSSDVLRSKMLSTTLNNFGCLERRRGNLEPALSYMNASQEASTNQSAATALNMCAILVQLARPEEAAGCARQAIGIIDSGHGPDFPGLRAIAHHNLAMALEGLDKQQCIDAYANALEFAKQELGPDSATTQSIEKNYQRYQKALQIRGGIIRNTATTPGSGQQQQSAGRTGGTPSRQQQQQQQQYKPQSRGSMTGSGYGRRAAPPQQQGFLPPIGPGPSLGGGHNRSSGMDTLMSSDEQQIPHTSSYSQPPPRGTVAPPQQQGVQSSVGPRPPQQPPPEQHRPPAARHSGPTMHSQDRDSFSAQPTPPSMPRQQQDGPKHRLSQSQQSEEVKDGSEANSGSLQGTPTTPAPPSMPSQPQPPQPTASKAPRRMSLADKPTAKTSERRLSMKKDSEPPRKPDAARPSGTRSPASQSLKPSAGGSGALAQDARRELQAMDADADDKRKEDIVKYMHDRLVALLRIEDEFEEQYCAAVCVQSMVRKALARIHVTRKKCQAKKDVQARVQSEQDAAAKIVAFLRHLSQRRQAANAAQAEEQETRVRERGAAIRIQCMARRWLARQVVKRLRIFFGRYSSGVLKVQCWMRRILAKLRVGTLLSARATANTARKQHARQVRAALDIQRVYRAHRAIVSVYARRGDHKAAKERARQYNRNFCATRIQSTFRGFRVRLQTKTKLKQRIKERQIAERVQTRRAAAISIQCLVRRYLACLRYGNAKHRAEGVRMEVTKHNFNAAATKIQCMARKASARVATTALRARRADRFAAARRAFTLVRVQALLRVRIGCAAVEVRAAKRLAYVREVRAREERDEAARKIQQFNRSQGDKKRTDEARAAARAAAAEAERLKAIAKEQFEVLELKEQERRIKEEHAALVSKLGARLPPPPPAPAPAPAPVPEPVPVAEPVPEAVERPPPRAVLSKNTAAFAIQSFFRMCWERSIVRSKQALVHEYIEELVLIHSEAPDDTTKGVQESPQLPPPEAVRRQLEHEAERFPHRRHLSDMKTHMRSEELRLQKAQQNRPPPPTDEIVAPPILAEAHPTPQGMNFGQLNEVTDAIPDRIAAYRHAVRATLLQTHLRWQLSVIAFGTALQNAVSRRNRQIGAVHTLRGFHAMVQAKNGKVSRREATRAALEAREQAEAAAHEASVVAMATVVQAAGRGALARLNVNVALSSQQLAANRLRAVAVLMRFRLLILAKQQKNARQDAVEKNVLALAQEDDAAAELAHAAKVFQQFRLMVKAKRAAADRWEETAIYNEYRIDEEHDEYVQDEKDAAAKSIQRLYRGAAAKKEVSQRRDARKERQEQSVAATAIQRRVRVAQAKEEAARRRQEREEAWARKAEAAQVESPTEYSPFRDVAQQ